MIAMSLWFSLDFVLFWFITCELFGGDVRDLEGESCFSPACASATDYIKVFARLRRRNSIWINGGHQVLQDQKN